jgi:hypothetical protein
VNYSFYTAMVWDSGGRMVRACNDFGCTPYQH